MGIRPVYSTRFLAWAAEETPPAYVVPTGYIAVVRDADITSMGGEITNWSISIAGTADFARGQFTIEALGQVFAWRGRVVLNPGEALVFQADGSTDGVICGYLLVQP